MHAVLVGDNDSGFSQRADNTKLRAGASWAVCNKNSNKVQISYLELISDVVINAASINYWSHHY